MYPKLSLYIDGSWRDAADGGRIVVVNPASGDPIGNVPIATRADLEMAVAAADKGFRIWSRISAFDRYRIMRTAAQLLLERADAIGRLITLEQGKPLAESRGETMRGADLIDWFAEEARRTYGRVIPARGGGILQMTVKEPVGPVAAFTPWNFPINQAVRKLSAALAAGCSVILKGPEETPASCAELVRVFADAGVPKGVVNLVFGVPAEISDYLIAHPVIRKVSFTGSTVVGKRIAMLAGEHMKRITLELGGHAPAIVFEDAELGKATQLLAASKFRNAGQICVAPSRLLVHSSIKDRFVESFVAEARAIKVGEGLDPGVTMGPLANQRRLEMVEALVADAIAKGAKLETGGRRIGNKGYFYAPTVFTDVPIEARIMNEEPFGPVAAITSFDSYDNVVKEANRLPYGLAAYAFTRSGDTALAISSDLEAGMVSINHNGLALPEVPFGGVKESGYGSEGGIEAMDAYLNTKFVTIASH